MRNFGYLILLIALSVGFISCQKEITGIVTATDSTNNGGGIIPPSTNGDLVIKVYGKAPTGLDSNVTYYTYNSAKKVVSRHILLNALGFGTDSWDWYERNSAGLIIRSKQYQVISNSPLPTDTTVTVHYYSTSATPVLLSSVKSLSLLGFSITDSLVYTYNSSGRTSKIEDYQTNFLSNTPTLTTRNVISYDAAGNEAKNESYSIAGTIATLSGTQTFEWDSKTEPTGYTEAESLILSSQPAAKHNNTKVTVVSTGTNSTNTFTYTYNSANKPATSVMKSVNMGFPNTTTNFTIYYQ